MKPFNAYVLTAHCCYYSLLIMANCKDPFKWAVASKNLKFLLAVKLFPSTECVQTAAAGLAPCITVSICMKLFVRTVTCD